MTTSAPPLTTRPHQASLRSSRASERAGASASDAVLTEPAYEATARRCAAQVPSNRPSLVSRTERNARSTSVRSATR